MVEFATIFNYVFTHAAYPARRTKIMQIKVDLCQECYVSHVEGTFEDQLFTMF
jgi:hypothetical protein